MYAPDPPHTRVNLTPGDLLCHVRGGRRCALRRAVGFVHDRRPQPHRTASARCAAPFGTSNGAQPTGGVRPAGPALHQAKTADPRADARPRVPALPSPKRIVRAGCRRAARRGRRVRGRLRSARLARASQHDTAPFQSPPSSSRRRRAPLVPTCASKSDRAGGSVLANALGRGKGAPAVMILASDAGPVAHLRSPHPAARSVSEEGSWPISTPEGRELDGTPRRRRWRWRGRTRPWLCVNTGLVAGERGGRCAEGGESPRRKTLATLSEQTETFQTHISLHISL